MFLILRGAFCPFHVKNTILNESAGEAPFHVFLVHWFYSSCNDSTLKNGGFVDFRCGIGSLRCGFGSWPCGTGSDRCGIGLLKCGMGSRKCEIGSLHFRR